MTGAAAPVFLMLIPSFRDPAALEPAAIACVPRYPVGAMNEADRQGFREIFAARNYVQAALVFGSFAKGVLKFESDLDVAILPAAPLDADQTMDLIGALAVRFGRPVDVIDLATQHGAIAREAITKGQVVYCRDRLAYAERLRRMVYDEADFLPILRSADRMAINKWLKTSYAPKSAR